MSFNASFEAEAMSICKMPFIWQKLLFESGVTICPSCQECFVDVAKDTVKLEFQVRETVFG